MKALAAQSFWTWFGKNQKALTFIQEMEEDESNRLCEQLDNQLVKVSPHLHYEIAGFENDKRQLVITTGGNPDYFPLAEELVKQAPKFEEWEIYALKPALPKGTFIRLKEGGVTFSNEQMWFQPFRKPSEPNDLRLVIFIRLPDFVEDQRLIAEGLFKMLYLTLGERSVSQDIQTIEIALVDDEPEERGVQPLRQLPEFIEYFNRERRGRRTW
ncbi:MAG: hypothetical protein AAB316_21770 [Bacteroidota bacterium]